MYIHYIYHIYQLYIYIYKCGKAERILTYNNDPISGLSTKTVCWQYCILNKFVLQHVTTQYRCYRHH